MYRNVILFLDHTIYEAALGLLLKNRFPKLEIETISQDVKVIPTLKTKKHSVFIFGVNSSTVRGLKLVREIRHADITAPILAISFYPETTYGIRLIKAGANAFISSQNSMEDLNSAMGKLMKGERYLTAYQSETMNRMILDGEKLGNVNELSEREFEVLTLTAEGNSMVEIGQILNISNHTASTYRSRVMKKLTLRNNVEITHFAFTNGLI